jgi:hypothetical protein
MIGKCRKCNTEMKCIKNGIEVKFNQVVTGFEHNAITLKCGNGDLWHCRLCNDYMVDGFNVEIREI